MIELRGLRKRFGSTTVLDGVDLAVPQGSLTGLIGRNGAGKTTTIEILVGLGAPDGGSATIGGRSPRAARAGLGYAPQSVSIWPDLTPRENLAFLARTYRRPIDPRALLARLGLAAQAGVPAARLSGGQQRLLNLALALVHDPPVLVLDEPTVGLDIEARELVWGLVRELVARGRTLLLTTHYLEEAERLCDRVAILARGQIVACGAPAELTAGLGFDAVVSVRTEQREAALAALRAHALAARLVDGRVEACVAGTPTVERVVGWLGGVPATGIATRAVSLEDVYAATAR